MTFVNWLRMFGMTLTIGTVVSLVIGLIVQLTDPEIALFDYSIIVFILSGLLYGTLSQLGFFAYMTINYIALDMFRQKKIWLYMQWFLVILALLYLVFLRAMSFDQLDRWLQFLVLPVLLFAASWFVARWKVKLTNPTAFTPTLFFLVVVTALEAIPALRENDALATAGMIIPLFACNAWQILNLHKYVKPRNADSGEKAPVQAGEQGRAGVAALGGGTVAANGNAAGNVTANVPAIGKKNHVNGKKNAAKKKAKGHSRRTKS